MDLLPMERTTDAEVVEAVPSFSTKNIYPPSTMVLMSGDEIEISFLGAPDLGITQSIRRDGRVSLRLVGEMVAAGKTPAEVREELINLYGSQIQFKEVTVKVLTSPPVFVMGAVLRPGSVDMPGRVDMSRPLTALDAISAAGGFDETIAEVRSVIIIRKELGWYRGFKIDCSPILHGRNDRTFYLQPYDIVYVPRTFIVKVDQWVEQHILKLIPALGIRYDISDKMSIYR